MIEDVIFDADDEAFVDPLAGFEVEFPFLTRIFPALRRFDVFEESGAPWAVACDAGWREGVVWMWREEVGLPFCGGLGRGRC